MRSRWIRETCLIVSRQNSAVTGVSLGYYTQRNVGPIQMSLQTTPEKARAAIRAAYEEIAHFTDPDYFTDEELESAKTILEAEDLFDREKPSEYAHTVSFWWASAGIDYFRSYLSRLRAVARAVRKCKSATVGKSGALSSSSSRIFLPSI